MGSPQYINPVFIFKLMYLRGKVVLGRNACYQYINIVFEQLSHSRLTIAAALAHGHPAVPRQGIPIWVKLCFMAQLLRKLITQLFYAFAFSLTKHANQRAVKSKKGLFYLQVQGACPVLDKIIQRNM